MTNLSINNLPKYLRPAAKFVRHKEQASGLSTSRFVQDFSVCMVPKATFSRSLPDLCENVFLEGAEESLIYFTPALLGENVGRKVLSQKLPEKLKQEVAKPAAELLKEKKEANKQVLPIKAAIALAATIIPLTEFSLNYIKNLMTLKVFKKSDFKNIASLENNKEDSAQQQKVEKSAKKHIALAGGIYGGLLGLAGLMATKGKNSKVLQNISEFILAPGTKLFKSKKTEKAKNFFDKYFSIDFNNHDGKLVMSKGQLTTCVLTGGAGYFGASADRGKENLKETATRFPIVAAYVITGSEFVEKGFKKVLKKMGKCKEIIGEKLEVPEFDKLGELAETISKKKNTPVEKEYKKLAKQKLLISGAPFVFSIGVMGFVVSGLTRYFTQKRYDNAHKG
ncbi:MAG: hypothetical protein K6E29_06645 [Cyanobacteria bacterium RUI128]|nr:hypothetical protein [Cyanobacteria bacterium RUI128]